MTSKYGVPASWRRQLGGTLKVQVEHLSIDISREMDAKAVLGDGFAGREKMILAVLRKAGRGLRPREIEDLARSSKTSVNQGLNRLEHRGLVRREAVPSRSKTPAFSWWAVAA